MEQESQLKRKLNTHWRMGSCGKLRLSTGQHSQPCVWHRNWDGNLVVSLMAPTLVTAKRNQPFMVAGTALYAQKPMRQSATFEVLIGSPQ
jgi:hypothetical protein